MAVLGQYVLKIDIWMRIDDLNRAGRNMAKVAIDIDWNCQYSFPKLDTESFSNIGLPHRLLALVIVYILTNIGLVKGLGW